MLTTSYSGYTGFGAALPEPEIIKFAQEVAEKSNVNGAAVVEVTNIFRLIDDFASQDAVALRAAVLAASVPGKVPSIQASLAEARQLPPISPTTVSPTIATTTAATTGLSRNAKIGIGVAAASVLAIGLTIGIARARR